ncbi:nose resistant to fluoxetine protein 6 [Ixodes scapularis]
MGFAIWSVSLALLLAATPYTVRPLDAQGEESLTRNIGEDMDDILKVAMQKFLPLISDVILRPEVSGHCSSALLKMFLGLQQGKPWALRMALSNALISSSILEGSYIAIGGYEQCLRTRVRSSSGELYFKGQYCNLFLDIPKAFYAELVKSFQEMGELKGRIDPLTLRTQRYQNADPRGAICIPSLCSAEDINFVVRSVLNLYGLNATAANCRTDDSKEISTLQAVSIAVLSTLLILVVIATVLEWIIERHFSSQKRSHGAPMQILLFFSAITNTRFLLNTELKPENEPLRFMAGFKVIMAFWVVFGHAYILVQPGFYQDINFVVRSVLNLYGLNATAANCRTDDSKEISTLQAVSIAVLSTLLILVVIATVLEWIIERHFSSQKRSHGAPMQILLFFSAITNTRFLLNTELKPENEPLRFMAGFKVIMAFWVVFGHAYILVQPGFYHALYHMADFTEDPSFQLVQNAFLSVTTFFYMSGFALSYVATTSREQIIRNNKFLIYINGVVRRYMRLTIPAAVLILAVFILPLLGSGPADEDTYMLMINGCVRNWWTVLVHTNNFNPDGEMCLLHLWYLSVDLQIFVFVAFPLGLMLLRYPKSACLAAVVVALALNCLVSSQVYLHDLFYGFTSGSNDGEKLARTMTYTYLRPFPQVSSYLTGVLCGYISAQHKNVSLHPILQAALWVTSFGLACFVMFVTYDWNNGHLPGVVVSALYAGFHRHLWSLVFVWPFYACATGRGGLINKFFGWTFFFPLSRLAFSIYLVHVLIYGLRQIRMRTYVNGDEYFLFTTSLGVFTLSTFFGYLLYLTVEAPLIGLQKLIFDRASNPKPEIDSQITLEVKLEKSHL